MFCFARKISPFLRLLSSYEHCNLCEMAEKTTTNTEYWKKRWADRELSFHKDYLHPLLQKHLDKFVNGRRALRLFFPLCGKTIDMKWLYDRGHTIVGIEATESAIEEFFKEQNLEYTVQDIGAIKGSLVYQTKDGRLKLYPCDLFDFNCSIEEKFDGVWDGGSLEAIPPSQRIRYVSQITPLLKSDCRYFLQTTNYDTSKWQGPPHCISEKEIQTLFDKYNVEFIDKTGTDANPSFQQDLGLDYLEELLYLLTPKQVLKKTDTSVDYWIKRWDDRDIGFHKEVLQPLLEKHIDKLINGRQALRLFFPLCGKTIDMKWLYDQGHTIVGVEAVPSAVEEFFKEQNLEYTVHDIGAIKGSLYKTKDGRLKLYLCDLFDFNSSIEGEFDGVWDRGSLVAISPSQKTRYVSLMTSLMNSDCRYLLQTQKYDPTKWPGPPHYIPEEEIQALFDKTYNIELLEKRDAFTSRHAGWGLDYFDELLYLLTLKQDTTMDMSTKKKRKLDDWNESYINKDTGWHSTNVYPQLKKYADKMIAGRTGIKLFFPLCGKDVGMKWLYEEGHTIVGVDVSKQGVLEFFKEQNLEYTVHDIGAIKGSLYQTKDGRLKLYLCNLFDFNSSIEGKFDAIWDRASLVALNADDRVRYVSLMTSLMGPECNYILVTFEYDQSKREGDPFSVNKEDVLSLYDKKYNIEVLDVFAWSKDQIPFDSLDLLDEATYLLTAK